MSLLLTNRRTKHIRLDSGQNPLNQDQSVKILRKTKTLKDRDQEKGHGENEIKTGLDSQVEH